MGEARARARGEDGRRNAQSTVTMPMLPKLSIMVLTTAVSLTMPAKRGGR